MHSINEPIQNPQLIEEEKNGDCLKIINLKKNFDKLKVVNDVSLNIYKNQIFVLLGHNGAGKTTMISIISGMLASEGGKVMLENHNILENRKYLFQNIGLCSQDDIFFDDLTVQEHLEIMSELKGQKIDYQEITDLIQKLGLEDKKDSLAYTLSGGQKRKLCIGLALIGKSKFILLDEPTSGMDVTAKRSLWSFLKSYKSNKIILLTTHSLDEADYLADRIGIMSEGRIVCTGTSSFLKNQYSCGYSINFLFDNVILSKPESKNVKLRLIEEMRKIDSSLLVKVVSKECVVLNFPSISKNTMDVFNKIDELKDSLGISNYTISTTSLEDVFLKINSHEVSKNLFEDQLKSESSKETSLQINSNDFQDNILNRNEEITLNKTTWTNDLKLSLTRHFISNWRNKKNFLLEIFASLFSFFVSFLCFNVFINSSPSLNPYKILTKSSPKYSFNPQFALSYNDFSSVYPGIKLEPLDYKEITTIENLDEIIYNENTNHNTKGAFYIQNYVPNSDLTTFIVYPAGIPDYAYALNNVILSSILKKDYNIQTNLLVK
jgi:ATP-binding cassette subfamily A (ABC1) protein 3